MLSLPVQLFFGGQPVSRLPDYATDYRDTYGDAFGEEHTNPHDAILTKRVDGEAVGILVADEDAKNCGVEHPYPELPHLMGLYVREPHRSEGIAAGLIHEFVDSVEQNRCVITCDPDLDSFYACLECEIAHLRQFK